MTRVHINRARADRVIIRRVDCSGKCAGRRSYHLAWLQEWYGWLDTCLRCGDQWADEGGPGLTRMERPFEPKWWVRNIESARRMYLSWKASVSEPTP